MAELPAYHGRTHAAGGTDPIPITSGLPVAIGRQFATSMVRGTLLFTDISWNDDSLFGYAGVTGSAAKYVTVNQDGTYFLQANVFWDTDWTVGDNPFIVPLIYTVTGGIENPLVNALGVDELDDTQNMIYGEQFTAAEMDHHQLAANFTFGLHIANYTGETSIGFGVKISSSVSRTKGFGGGIALTRLGDAPVTQTIV